MSGPRLLLWLEYNFFGKKRLYKKVENIISICDQKQRQLELGKLGNGDCNWDIKGLGIEKIVEGGSCQEHLCPWQKKIDFNTLPTCFIDNLLIFHKIKY